MEYVGWTSTLDILGTDSTVQTYSGAGTLVQTLTRIVVLTTAGHRLRHA